MSAARPPSPLPATPRPRSRPLPGAPAWRLQPLAEVHGHELIASESRPRTLPPALACPPDVTGLSCPLTADPGIILSACRLWDPSRLSPKPRKGHHLRLTVSQVTSPPAATALVRDQSSPTQTLTSAPQLVTLPFPSPFYLSGLCPQTTLPKLKLAISLFSSNISPSRTADPNPQSPSPSFFSYALNTLLLPESQETPSAQGSQRVLPRGLQARPPSPPPASLMPFAPPAALLCLPTMPPRSRSIWPPLSKQSPLSLIRLFKKLIFKLLIS